MNSYTATEDNPQRPTHETSVKSEAQASRAATPYVTVWQDEQGVIQVKLGNGITPVNAIALLELGVFSYKVKLLPSISPRPAKAPGGSEPPK